MTDHERFLDHLKKRAYELCPDYPWSKGDGVLKEDGFEHLWAITSSLEGTNKANDDCHAYIKELHDALKTIAKTTNELSICDLAKKAIKWEAA